MNIIEDRIESDGLSRALPGMVSVSVSTPHPLAPPASAAVSATRRGVAAPVRPASERMHWIAQDKNSSQLVKLPYLMNVLVVDIGGTHVKVLATGEKLAREFDSGPALNPKRMVQRVRKTSG